MTKTTPPLPPFAHRLTASLTAVFFAHAENDFELAFAVLVDAVNTLTHECVGPHDGPVHTRARDYCYAVHAYIRGLPHYYMSVSRTPVYSKADAVKFGVI